MSSINNLCIPAEIWQLIFAHLRNEDLSEVLLTNTYFYEHVQQSGLLSRPTWQWANYQKILLEHQLTISGEVYKSYPLYQGDMAFALQEDYIRNYNSGYFKRHGWTGRSYPKWKFCQNIIVFCVEADQSIELKGHSGAIEHVIQHTKSLLASLGQDGTIRVWEKLTGSLQQTIRIKQQEKPFYLVSLNHEELACFARNGTAQVWNISTGEWARELLRLDIPEKRIFKCMRHKDFLFIYHNLPQVGDYRHDSLFSVLDLKQEQIIQTLVPENLKPTLGNYVQQELIKKPFGWLYNPEPENLLSRPLRIIDCQHYIAVIEQARTNTYYFFDIKNNKPIFGVPDRNLQYKYLSNGTLVILHHTLEGWHVLANYCHEIGDFAVKYTFEYSKSEEGKHIYDDFKGCYYEDRAWTILPNGNIIIYYWQREIAHQWCLSRQTLLDFQLEKPEIPLSSMENNCQNNRALKSLPNGNILACSLDGVIVIWEGTSGKILLNTHITSSDEISMSLNDHEKLLRQWKKFIKVHGELITIDEIMTKMVVDFCNCVQVLSNGDLYMTWRETNTPELIWSGDHYKAKLLRFSVFGNKTQEEYTEKEEVEYPQLF